MLSIEVTSEDPLDPAVERKLQEAVRRILSDAEIGSGDVSIAVVGDATMHRLNREYLEHDYPTDVLSFVLTSEEGRLEGEIIASAEYAAREALQYGWNAADELLLYVIHGALHLVGYDDLTPDAKQQIRDRERHYLAHFGLTPRYDERE